MPDAFMFVAGGTVQAGGGIYLERDADRLLLQHCRAGDFTYVLTSRQMGKSSLMIRAAERLAEEGVRPIVIDLTELGAQATADQWYKGFLSIVQDQLGLATSVSAWWNAQSDHGLAQRFTRYLREVALVERAERLVLFVDEIDTTLRLDFTDDFFAAIRFLYQQRATDPVLQRLSFVLVGVATPGDLIKDSARTPFNIGHRIDLTDFTPQEASALAQYVPLPPALRSDLVDWVLRWTGGHPYLTLRVFRSLVEQPPPVWTAAAVEARVADLFFGPGGESDSNLQFVRDMLTKKAFDREAVLRAYLNVRSGVRVPDRELDQVASWLRLSGVACRRDGALQVRNAIYERVFDQRWASEHLRLNINWKRRLVRVGTALLGVAILATIPLGIYAWVQKQHAEHDRDLAMEQKAEADRQRLLAEENLARTTAALHSAEAALDALRRYDPKAAAIIGAQVATERDRTARELQATMASLRAERDDALKKLQASEQAGESLLQELARLRGAGPAPDSRAEVDVPNLIGRQVNDASSILKSLGLGSRVTFTESSEAPAGTVIRQMPIPDTWVARGLLVMLVVSSGAPAVPPRPSKFVAESVRVPQRGLVYLHASPLFGRLVIGVGNVAKEGTPVYVMTAGPGLPSSIPDDYESKAIIARGRLTQGGALDFVFEARRYRVIFREIGSAWTPYVVIDIVAQ